MMPRSALRLAGILPALAAALSVLGGCGQGSAVRSTAYSSAALLPDASRLIVIRNDYELSSPPMTAWLIGAQEQSTSSRWYVCEYDTGGTLLRETALPDSAAAAGAAALVIYAVGGTTAAIGPAGGRNIATLLLYDAASGAVAARRFATVSDGGLQMRAGGAYVKTACTGACSTLALDVYSAAGQMQHTFARVPGAGWQLPRSCLLEDSALTLWSADSLVRAATGDSAPSAIAWRVIDCANLAGGRLAVLGDSGRVSFAAWVRDSLVLDSTICLDASTVAAISVDTAGSWLAYRAATGASGAAANWAAGGRVVLRNLASGVEADVCVSTRTTTGR